VKKLEGAVTTSGAKRSPCWSGDCFVGKNTLLAMTISSSMKSAERGVFPRNDMDYGGEQMEIKA